MSLEELDVVQNITQHLGKIIAELQAENSALKAERQAAENDYKDMRRFQAEFMRVDHELRELKEQGNKMPTWDAMAKWADSLKGGPSARMCYDWLRDKIEGTKDV